MLARTRFRIAAAVVVALLASVGTAVSWLGTPGLPIPAGTVVHVRMRTPVAAFTVSRSGGQLVGAYSADHTVILWVFPAGQALVVHCNPVLGGFGSPPIDVVFNESLEPGEYILTPVCGAEGNVTVTHTIQVVYPGPVPVP